MKVIKAAHYISDGVKKVAIYELRPSGHKLLGTFTLSEAEIKFPSSEYQWESMGE